MEFATPGGVSAVSYIVSVRDMKTGHTIVSSTIVYNSRTLSSIPHEMVEHQRSRGKNTCRFMFADYFSKFYHSDYTSGLSIPAVGDKLRDNNFDTKTHRVCFWSSSLDCYMFNRALGGSGDLIDTTPNISATPESTGTAKCFCSHITSLWLSSIVPHWNPVDVVTCSAPCFRRSI